MFIYQALSRTQVPYQLYTINVKQLKRFELPCDWRKNHFICIKINAKQSKLLKQQLKLVISRYYATVPSNKLANCSKKR